MLSRLLYMFSHLLAWSILLSLISSHTTNSLAVSNCDFSSPYKVWKVCGNDSTSDQTCVNKLNCCLAPEEFVRKHNSSTRCYKPSSSGTYFNGTCVKYDGDVCWRYFNESLRRNITKTETILRFLDNRIPVERVDGIIDAFFKALKAGVVRKECLDILSPAMCQYVIPSCPGGNARLICREDCEYFVNICADDYKRVIGAVQYILTHEKVDFPHVFNYNLCTVLDYSWEFDEFSNATCTYVVEGLVRKRPVPLTPKKDRTLVYVAVSAGVLLPLLIIVIMLVIRYLSRKKQKYLKDGNYDDTTTMTSVRDRIRQDNQYNVEPLLALLASSQPSTLVQCRLDSVEYMKDLGEGQFGKVFLGRVHGILKDNESSDVAVKCLKEGSSSQAVKAFHQEVQLMSCLQHDNILCLLAVSTEAEPYCMIFEFMEKGDLNEFLRTSNGKEELNDAELLKICVQIAAGMEYLSSKKVLHRDLATRNCLVGKDLTVKIADFGMSRNVYHSDYYRVGGEAMLPVRWMPPEAILYGKFTVETDVYSFGVVLWEIFNFALQPFYGYSNAEVVEFIKKGVLLPQPEDCPDWIYNIMLDCWKREPDERITFSHVLQVLKEKSQNLHYDILPISNMNKTREKSALYENMRPLSCMSENTETIRDERTNDAFEDDNIHNSLPNGNTDI